MRLPVKTRAIEADCLNSVTVASILRFTYLMIRYFSGSRDDLLTEWQVMFIIQYLSCISYPPLASCPPFHESPTNDWPPVSHSTVELNIAILCCCLTTLKAFMRRWMPRVLTLGPFSKKTQSRLSTGAASLPQVTNNQDPLRSSPAPPTSSGVRPEEAIRVIDEDENIGWGFFHSRIIFLLCRSCST